MNLAVLRLRSRAGYGPWSTRRGGWHVDHHVGLWSPGHRTATVSSAIAVLARPLTAAAEVVYDHRRAATARAAQLIPDSSRHHK